MIMWNRVVTIFAPGMTGEQSFKRKSTAFENSKTLYSFDGIFRTAGSKTTVTAQKRADGILVKPDW